jgi:hypothetical protein
MKAGGIQVVIRPPESTFNLTDFAARHAADSQTLSERLRYARDTRAPGFAWDVVSAEIQNVGRGGWRIDMHFHLTTRGANESELRKIQAYFEARGWSFWFTPSDAKEAGRHPAALVQYQSKGLAKAVADGEWRPDALVELRRQTRDIALTRATGGFRRWKTEIAQAGLVAVEDRDGKPTLAPRRVIGPRLRRKLCQSTSVVALRLCVHDFGDGLFRRSIRVRGGRDITLAEVSAVYDLSPATLSKGNAAIPESTASTAAQPTEPLPLARPNGVPPPTTWLEVVPW